MLDFLSSLGVDTAGFDQWGLHLAGLESRLTWVLILAAAIVLVLWTRSSVSDVHSAWRRVFLAALQAAAMALLVLILLQPAIRLAKVAEIKERVAVAVDTSESMSLPAGGGRSRARAALGFLDGNRRFFEELESEYALTYFGFDSGLHRMESRPEEIRPAGEGTDIMAAVSGLADPGPGTPLAGVILISDGADTRRMDPDREAGMEELLGNYPSPVNTVFSGGGVKVTDLAIIEARHDDYGFVHNPFQMMVKVRAEGSPAKEVPVIFRQDDKMLSTKTLKLTPGQEQAEATLGFTPRQVGEFMFSVEVPPVAGELTRKNNLIRFPLKVLRDKVRVLYIVGNPSWDERFLRGSLKKDPSVDLVSFYILREHWDDYRSRQEEVSLIPFPTHKLFTEELDTFDMVIWQNFRGSRYMTGNYGKYMSELNRFVKKRGGAFLMIGGHRAFFGQGRMDPKLRDLLPVEPADPAPNYVQDEFKVQVTDEGLRHPIMDVGEGRGQAAAIWSDMPELGGYNRVERAKPDALVLAVHPTERAGEERLPVVAVQEAGAGRVMAIMTDTTWHWNFVAVGEGMSNKPYQRFYENSLRWLLRDPEMRLITLSAEPGRVKPGQRVKVVLTVLDHSYQPTDDADVSVKVEQEPEGSGLELPGIERFGIGKYRMEVVPEKEGGYRLRARAEIDGRSLGTDHVVFEAAKDSIEWKDVRPRPGLLESISKATGGAAITASGDADDLVFSRKSVEQVIGVRDVPLWDNPAVFLLCFGMLVSGWYLRRKWGLR